MRPFRATCGGVDGCCRSHEMTGGGRFPGLLDEARRRVRDRCGFSHFLLCAFGV